MRHMSLISPTSLAAIAGISTRQLQRMALAGKVPTAKRTTGGHWEITDSKEVMAWASSVLAHKQGRLKSNARRMARPFHDVQKAQTALHYLKAQIARPETTTHEREAAADIVEGLARELRSGWGVEIVSAPARRGGAWKAVEQAEETIRHWHKEHWEDATESERNHFRSLMRRMEGIAEAVLSGGV